MDEEERMFFESNKSFLKKDDSTLDNHILPGASIQSYAYTYSRPDLSFSYLVQCDTIRWEQFLRRCRLGQL